MKLQDKFNEIEKHLLEDDKPSSYLNELKTSGELSVEPFNWLISLEKIEQSPKHHPEGDVWVHTMMVVDKGSSYRDYVEDKKVFMWALLLHDLGKRSTTKLRNGRWTSYDHDKVGRKDAYDFLSYFKLSEEFKGKVSILVRYHMHLLFIMNKLPYGDIKGMKTEANLHDLSYVFLSDRLGRGGMNKEEIEKVENEVDLFRKKFLK
ncbi:multifunctional tRNA nucleotidyl transferase/2'3'-cyclic phosphodiesterase/2'nucleotidase/phosphatase [Clostridium paraputrificum]|uniref:Multifunctional tRNA nucleotidyl transferase/2'3'-cyclic phosphodiesterase/2'nucleotidase/phosphatase n=1 Tax=Clostridium paraputrificum TaxID=29363 RepID=A0A6N3FYX0_9CLOT|nr:HD domain-containing protein [Clostridium sp.]